MITGLLLFAAAVAAAWLALGLTDARSARRPLPRIVQQRPAEPRIPHWARHGHLPTSSSAALGRHRRQGGSR
jgi:hypothetical protein